MAASDRLPECQEHESASWHFFCGFFVNLIKKSLTTRFGQNRKKHFDFLRRAAGGIDIQELRELTAYDELELDTLGDRKAALFLIMSDTDDSFNFLISMCYTQLFKPSV